MAGIKAVKPSSPLLQQAEAPRTGRHRRSASRHGSAPGRGCASSWGIRFRYNPATQMPLWSSHLRASQAALNTQGVADACCRSQRCSPSCRPAHAQGLDQGRDRGGFRPVAPATPAATSRCWPGGIKYIRTSNSWRYLAVRIDLLYSRRVVGRPIRRHRGAGGPEPGRGPSPDRIRSTLDPYRSGQPVTRHCLSTVAGRPQDQLQHVGQGLLLGQRRGGELLLHPQTRAGPR